MVGGIIYWVFGLAVLIVLLYGGFLVLVTWPIDKLTIQNAGVFGDSFGVLTSLFSALAFCGVVLTLFYQKEELRIQKIEWQAQKEENEDSRNEIRKQGFENSFFQMLRLHNQIVEGISQPQSNAGGAHVNDGRSVLKTLSSRLYGGIARKGGEDNNDKEIILEAYSSFWATSGHHLAHYFRFLYNIFRFLSESDIENKVFYVRLVRAQLSNQELFLIYYNSFTKQGENFQKYIVEFKLMDNLPRDELVNSEHSNLLSGSGFHD